MSEKIGHRIRWFRKQRNLTQDDLALPMGKTKSSISDWERERATPSLGEIEKLSEILGCSPSRLAFGSEISGKRLENMVPAEPRGTYGGLKSTSTLSRPLIADPKSYPDAATAGILEDIEEHFEQLRELIHKDPEKAAVVRWLMRKHLKLEELVEE